MSGGSIQKFNKWTILLGPPQEASPPWYPPMMKWGYPSTGVLRVTQLKKEKGQEEERYKVELLPREESMLHMVKFIEELTWKALNTWFEENKHIILQVLKGA